jgi:hypothetical protein
VPLQSFFLRSLVGDLIFLQHTYKVQTIGAHHVLDSRDILGGGNQLRCRCEVGAPAIQCPPYPTSHRRIELSMHSLPLGACRPAKAVPDTTTLSVCSSGGEELSLSHGGKQITEPTSIYFSDPGPAIQHPFERNRLLATLKGRKTRGKAHVHPTSTTWEALKPMECSTSG